MLTKFCTPGEIPDVIISADFGMEKSVGLGYTAGQSLGSPIETAGHPCTGASIPMGQGGHVPPNIWTGDMITNVPPQYF